MINSISSHHGVCGSLGIDSCSPDVLAGLELCPFLELSQMVAGFLGLKMASHGLENDASPESLRSTADCSFEEPLLVSCENVEAHRRKAHPLDLMPEALRSLDTRVVECCRLVSRTAFQLSYLFRACLKKRLPFTFNPDCTTAHA